MHKREYQTIKLSKRESEWVAWFQTASDKWEDAFYFYRGRKNRYRTEQFLCSWFNRTLKKLQAKGLFDYVPFAFISDSGIRWVHPRVANDGYVVEVGDITDPELLTVRKPIL